MNENLRRQLDSVIQNLESRAQAEKIIFMVVLIAVLALSYLSIGFDPIRADINTSRTGINGVNRQILAQQNSYAEKYDASLEDPDKFANDRLVVIARAQAQLQGEINSLAGDFVTPNEMTNILTSVLERQAGLELVSFGNQSATPLREGISNVAELLAATGAVNLDDVVTTGVSGQVYEHGLVIEFEGDFFNTLKYLRFLEDITGSFFWDSISFRQLDWPNAHITLEIHTLSTNQGFIGV
ncbi:MAG: hypothetical protein IIC59_01445 [Proteobacteria bacterium]|nr:hypothetical protein [Pseudomonadota bacterium]MCH8173825.1 hypothetical protein [Pseudomonadota bacterium]